MIQRIKSIFTNWIQIKRLNVFVLFLVLAFVISMVAKLSNQLSQTLQLKLIPTQMVFEGEKLIMDMYALSRMTKSYNKNVVVMAGHNHYNNYLHFFQFVKFYQLKLLNYVCTQNFQIFQKCNY